MKNTLRTGKHTSLKLLDELTVIITTEPENITLSPKNPKYNALKINPHTYSSDDVVGIVVREGYIYASHIYEITRAIASKATLVLINQRFSTATSEYEGIRSLIAQKGYMVSKVTDHTVTWKFNTASELRYLTARD